jgi:chromosomal replication initiation ATPase DnaA
MPTIKNMLTEDTLNRIEKDLTNWFNEHEKKVKNINYIDFGTIAFNRPKGNSVDKLIENFIEFHEIDFDLLNQKTNSRTIVMLRQKLMFLIRVYFHLSYNEILNIFLNSIKTHPSVLMSVRRAFDDYQSNPVYRRQMTEFCRSFGLETPEEVGIENIKKMIYPNRKTK